MEKRKKIHKYLGPYSRTTKVEYPEHAHFWFI